MVVVRARITPLSAFGTLPKGDTLFGQLCWSVRNRSGEEKLRNLLEGYTSGNPFAVVSDAFPGGYLPRPALPRHWFDRLPEADPKAAKKRRWLPVTEFERPVETWLEYCSEDRAVPGGRLLTRPQPHNAINRQTGTTGQNFTPYSMTRHWYAPPDREDNQDETLIPRLDIYAVLDESRLSVAELRELLADIGQMGFGRDASVGLGRFRVEALEQESLPVQSGADSWLTLAPCAPQGHEWDSQRSFYQIFTRFGRHGDVAVHRGRPFKTPVLLADSAAVLVPKEYRQQLYIGRGLGGNGSLSRAIEATVHQGYAPVVGIKVPRKVEVLK